MKPFINKVYSIIKSQNQKPNTWSYLTSINYMLDSDLYVKSLYSGASILNKYVNKNTKSLDFGTGSGVFALILRDLYHDLSINAVDTVDNTSQKDPNFKDTSKQQNKIWKIFSKQFNISFKHFNGQTLPYNDNQFDIITACAVFEHISPHELPRVFPEIKRILRPGGILLVLKFPRKQSYAEFIAKVLKIGSHDILFSDEEAEKFFVSREFALIKRFRSEMVFEFPGKVTNKVKTLLSLLDHLLLHTPLSLFAHHNNLILRNEKAN